MTRTVPAALQTTLSGAEMSLALLVKIKRLDGAVICLTTWDKPLSTDMDGEGAFTYNPQNIEGVTTFSASINAAIDDSELTVPIDSEFIGDDIRRGFYAAAIVKIGYVDPDDLSHPWYHRYYEVGQVTIDGISIKFELLGPEKRLENQVGVPLTLNCRYQFGDSDCGINIDVPIWEANTTYNEGDEIQPGDGGKLWFYASSAGTGGIGTSGPTAPTWAAGTVVDNDIVWTSFNARKVLGIVTAVTDKRNFGANGIDIANDYFAEGYIEWLHGRNAGEKQRVQLDNGIGSIIQHRECLDFPEIGDTFYAIVGCRKRLEEDCVTKHNNAVRSISRTLRFGGFPFLAPELSTLTAPKEDNNNG